MVLTEEQVKHLLHGNKDWADWVEPLQTMLPKYEINTADRIAGFIAQCGHESLNFKVLEENLNYSAGALDKIFPKYFKRAGRDAQEYHRQPEKIANVIYASRMSNGDTASGDGYRFRGRGVIQLTGRANYTAFGKTINKTAEEVIDYLGTKTGALESACWYWNSRNLNAACDAQDIVKMTKLVNGGTIGLEDRKHHYHRALEILGGTYEPKPEPILLKVGSRGEYVKKIQEKLGLEADGIFGKMTAEAVKDWQASKGLTADGIVGPKTFKAMLI